MHSQKIEVEKELEKDPNFYQRKVFSFSKLEKFDKCPLSYYFYYLDPKWKGYSRPRDYKTKGLAIHGALTLFYHLESRGRTLENLKKCLKEAWFSETDPSKNPPLGQAGGFRSLYQERKVYWECLKILESFFKLGDINPKIFYIPTKNIRYSFDDYKFLIKPINEWFFVSGKFDRIDELEDGTLRIIDFKTSKNQEDRFQLDFYKILAELNFNIPVSTISFYYLSPSRIVDFPIYESSKEDIEEKILKKLGVINSAKEFIPKPSRLCSHCDFKETCPVFESN